MSFSPTGSGLTVIYNYSDYLMVFAKTCWFSSTRSQLNAVIWKLAGSGILSHSNHHATIADLSNWGTDNRNCPARGTIVYVIRNQAKSGFTWAVLPHRLNYSSPTSPTALNDVMGSAVERDERDKAEPAGTRQLPAHTLHNTAWEPKRLRIQPLSQA